MPLPKLADQLSPLQAPEWVPSVMVSVLGPDTCRRSRIIDSFIAACPYCPHEVARDLDTDLASAMFTATSMAAGRAGRGAKADAHAPVRWAGRTTQAQRKPEWQHSPHISVRSLKFYARQAILQHGVPYERKRLPHLLADYMDLLRSTVCTACNAVALKDYRPPIKLQRFEKIVSWHGRATRILFLDVPPWTCPAWSLNAGGLEAVPDRPTEDALYSLPPLHRLVLAGTQVFLIVHPLGSPVLVQNAVGLLRQIILSCDPLPASYQQRPAMVCCVPDAAGLDLVQCKAQLLDGLAANCAASAAYLSWQTHLCEMLGELCMFAIHVNKIAL